jgi:hypothetical protein
MRKLLRKLIVFLFASTGALAAGAALLLVLTFLLRNVLYTSFVDYRNARDRSTAGLIADKEIRAELAAWAKANPEASARRMHGKALDITARELQFSLKASSDVSTILSTHKAHCVGYSRLYCASFNTLAKETDQSGDYRCKHRVGEIHLLGYNVHELFSSPSFKDHDFNVITDTKGTVLLATDPNLYDYSYISKVNVGR